MRTAQSGSPVVVTGTSRCEAGDDGKQLWWGSCGGMTGRGSLKRLTHLTKCERPCIGDLFGEISRWFAIGFTEDSKKWCSRGSILRRGLPA